MGLLFLTIKSAHAKHFEKSGDCAVIETVDRDRFANRSLPDISARRAK
jgi:hypothetical protein